MSVRKVGVRELKDRLSAYLREVKAGEVVQVTEHGHVVAELRPPRGTAEPLTDKQRRYQQLVAEGRIIPAKEARRFPFADLLRGPPRKDLKGLAQELIDFGRGE